MKNGRKLYSKDPHPDIENKFQRGLIPYFITYPDKGGDENIGLIFTITGFGMHPEQEYEIKLRHYLANKYNCIVVGIDYFGCRIKHPRLENMEFSETFFEEFEKMHGMKLGKASELSMTSALPMLGRILQPMGINRFEPPLYLLNKNPDFYQSFGILPALDYLQVLAELLENEFINKQRLYILGTSYGGYIGLLLGKLAPKTFRFIVDNAGFSEACLPEVYGANRDIGAWVDICGFNTFLKDYSPWVDDIDSPHYFSEYHKDIRSLLISEHILPSKTEYYCFHSQEDTVAPVEHKEQFKTLRENMDIELDIVTEERIDGKIFKHIQHGMGASLRSLFGLAYESHLKKNKEPNSKTDFDLQSEYLFPCSNGYGYKIKFDCHNVVLELYSD